MRRVGQLLRQLNPALQLRKVRSHAQVAKALEPTVPTPEPEPILTPPHRCVLNGGRRGD